MFDLIGAFLAEALSDTWLIVEPTHTAQAYVAPAVHKVPSLEEIVDAAADKHGVPQETLRNLAYSESRWNPVADNGHDRGLFQINRDSHSEVSDECAFDPECAADWTAKRIADGYAHEWVAANCYLFVEVVTPYKLPLMRDIVPNTTPHEGAVAIFSYPEKHIAYVEKLTDKGFIVREANYHPGLIATRTVEWTDSSLVGFYTPASLALQTKGEH